MKKGFKFISSSGLEYEKLGDNEFDWWVCTNSLYLKELKPVGEGHSPDDYELRPESEKPLYNKAAAKNAKIINDPDRYDSGSIDKDSILNCYPLTNIV